MRSKFHHETIYRGEKFRLLAGLKVAVCGAGAVGSNLVETLVRQGLTQVKVIDMDRVEVHNVGTQVYGEKDIGALKAEALKNRLFRDVGVEIEASHKELTPGNARQLLKGCDLVVDGFDNSKSRRAVQEYCRGAKQACLHVGLFEDYGEIVWDDVYRVPADVEGDVCDYPLARNLITIVVAVAADEVVNHVLTPGRHRSFSVTLKDFAVREY